MPKLTTTPTVPLRHEAPTDTTTRDATEHDDMREQARTEEARPRSPQDFYAELTARPDMRAFLKRLADR